MRRLRRWFPARRRSTTRTPTSHWVAEQPQSREAASRNGEWRGKRVRTINVVLRDPGTFVSCVSTHAVNSVGDTWKNLLRLNRFAGLRPFDDHVGDGKSGESPETTPGLARRALPNHELRGGCAALEFRRRRW